ncbi:MAG: ATP-binding protein [Nitrospiraceae bacterium]|nr:ATP-binding protein [Nitrospiraceae bacterium]
MQQAVHEGSPAVGSLVASDICVHPSTSVRTVVEKFFESPQIEAFGVVEGREAVGLLTRQKLLFSVFRRYGFELYGRKPVIMITDTEPLYIYERERLDVAINKALARPSQDVYDEIVIIDEDGFYKGLLPVRQMIIQQSNLLANSIVQREMAHERAKELEKINHVKSQFIANVTHELRSPVNAIIGRAELMKISCEKGYIDQLRDRLNLVMSGAAHLRAIITNILDLSKIEAGKMEIIYEEFDIMGTIREVTETTRVLLGAKPVDVSIESGFRTLTVMSDPIKIKQILTNLTSNAAKFTDRGRITLGLLASHDELTITVKDTGIGIKKEDMDRLFIAFSQVGDVTTKRHEGTGLGLTITKSLAHMLGGGIAMDSEFGRGTTFEVTMPITHNTLISQEDDDNGHRR